MNSFNPFQMMFNTMNNGMPPAFMNKNVQAGQPQINNLQNNHSINQDQFRQYLPNINDNILQLLADKARQQGISEEDIKQGINFIQQLKQNQ